MSRHGAVVPVPAIAIHESGKSVDIARAMDANFAGSSYSDRVVTLGFDWDHTVPRLDHKGLRHLLTYLKRNATNMGEAARLGLEFGIHSLDTIIGALQVRLHRLLQWVLSAFVGLLFVRWLAEVVVLGPAAWYGLPTLMYSPMQWLATATAWLQGGVAAGAVLFVALGGLRLVLTLSPRPTIVTFRSIALLFLQPLLIATIAVLVADTVVLWIFLVLLSLPAFVVSGTGALAPWGIMVGVLLALRHWGRPSIGEPIKAMLRVFRYLGEPGYRWKIQQALDKAIVRSRKRAGEEQEFVLAGQGMGTIIALDSILHSREWRRSDRVLLVTMGSPLCRYFLRLYPCSLFPESMEDLVDSVVLRLDEFRWINVYRPGDYMGAGLGLRPFKGCDLSTGWTTSRAINHKDYWRSMDARHAVHASLEKLNPVQAPPVRIKNSKHALPSPRSTMRRFDIPLVARRAIWATLFLATFGWTVRWVATVSGLFLSPITETPELLERRGVVVAAAATHRREIIRKDERLAYVDHWRFDFNDTTGTAKRLHVQFDVRDAFATMLPLRFDVREFTRQIRAGCGVDDERPAWLPNRNMNTSCTMRDVQLRYYPRDAALLDLPDFPPGRELHNPSAAWTEAGVAAAVLSLLLLIPAAVGVRFFELILG